ncbi:MAG: sugar ABC transporter substrate-binding protein [bacterium]|nr:sugar ABC transporter substrate-binding protein [bacterium]
MGKIRTLIRSVQIIIVSVCIVLFLVTCGSNRLSQQEKDSKVIITWMVGVDFYKPMYEELISRFEQLYPNIQVEMMWVPGTQYQTKLKTLIAANQAPDIIYTGDVWVAYLLPYLADITDYITRDAGEMDLEDIYPEILHACQWNGRFYFVPRWFNVSLLYYNKKIFREAGVPYPTSAWTWNDYITAAQKLTKIGKDGKVEIWGSNIMTGWWGEWLIFVRQAGGEMFNETVTKCTLDTQEAIQGIRFYYDKIYTYKISPKPGYGPDKGFASNKLAMDYGGHTGLWLIYNKFPELEWDIEILPKGPKTRTGGELALDAVGMSKTTKHPEEVWQFLKFICSKESIRRHAQEGFIPIRKSVAQEFFFRKNRTENPQNIQALYEQLKYCKQIPKLPDYIELASDVIQPDIDRMLIEQIEPEKICKKITNSTNKFLETIGSK